MAKFKYKIVEAAPGEVSSNRGVKTTVTNVDPETGAITWKVEDAPDFESVFEYFKKTRDFLTDLSRNPAIASDQVIQNIQAQVIKTFNQFRTHFRKTYPEEYNKIKSIVNEISTISSTSGFMSGTEGENHTGPSPNKSTYGAYTQAGFKKVPKYKYKLKEANTDVESFLKDTNINEPSRKKFIASRILGFDEIQRKLNQLIPLLQQAKHKTIDYYRQNPDSYNVVYGTDLANDYLNDLLELFKD
jgi:hypothetical protein